MFISRLERCSRENFKKDLYNAHIGSRPQAWFFLVLAFSARRAKARSAVQGIAAGSFRNPPKGRVCGKWSQPLPIPDAAVRTHYQI